MFCLRVRCWGEFELDRHEYFHKEVDLDRGFTFLEKRWKILEAITNISPAMLPFSSQLTQKNTTITSQSLLNWSIWISGYGKTHFPYLLTNNRKSQITHSHSSWRLPWIHTWPTRTPAATNTLTHQLKGWTKLNLPAQKSIWTIMSEAQWLIIELHCHILFWDVRERQIRLDYFTEKSLTPGRQN